jgi:hypothetical protein
LPFSTGSGAEEVDASVICEDVAQAVAQRSLACTNDPDLGNRRYHGVLDSFACVASGASYKDDPRFNCSRSIGTLDCAEVEARNVLSLTAGGTFGLR